MGVGEAAVQAVHDLGRRTPGLTVSLLANLVIVVAFLLFLREQQKETNSASLQTAIALQHTATALDALKEELRDARADR